MRLGIKLLGQFKITAGELPVNLPSRQAQSLFAFLALNAGITYRREKLASLLWGESSESNSRRYLRQALWRIRKAFENNPLSWEDYFEIDDIAVTFNRDADYWLDSRVFLETAADRPINELIDAASLYQGELLPGFYEEWVVSERARFQASYSQKMDHLLKRLIESHRWDEVRKWSEEWIRLGDAPEPAYRALMTAYAASGNLGMVNSTYQRCVEAIKNDLGVEPSAETTRLYEQIRLGDLDGMVSHPEPLTESSSQLPSFLNRPQPYQVEKKLFVAREHQLEQLDIFLDLALRGQGRVIFITGEAGSGKTTLVEGFTQLAHEINPDLIVASGHCNAQTGAGDPYLPFREILELLSGDVEARWSAGAISQDYAVQLWNLIPSTVQAIIEVGPHLIDTFLPAPTLLERARNYGSFSASWLERLESIFYRLSATLTGGSLQSDLFIQYVRVLQTLARGHPLLLVVDDLQWADLGSINLLFQLGRNLTGSRILVIGLYRPEEISMGRAGARHPLESIVNELQRIYGDLSINVDQASGRDFIDALLDSEPNRFDRSFRDLLYHQTGGHPLFTVELLRGMQERGDLVKDSQDRWVVGQALNWEKMPARIEAVVAERIERLDPPLQRALRTASVEGEVFTAEVTARALDQEPGEMLSRLSGDLDRKHRLIRAQSIQRVGEQLVSSYRFRHILVQKYLYNCLDEVEKVYTHERVGNALEGLYTNQEAAVAVAPQLARHFQEARKPEKAIIYLLQAGERALNLSAYKEAIAHLSKGLDFLEHTLDPSKYAQVELSLQFALGKALHGSSGNAPEMAQAFARARELSEESGETSTLCLVLSLLSIHYYVRAEFHQALEQADNILRLYEQVGDPLLQWVALWNQGVVLYALGEYTRARTQIGLLLDAYVPQKHHQDLVFSRGVDVGLSAIAYDACCLWTLGYPDQAAQQSQKALDLANEYDHAFTLADVLSYAGCQLSAMRRDAHSLEIYSDELMRLSRDRSLGGWLSTAICSKGEALLLQGQFDEGKALLEEGMAMNQSLNIVMHFPHMLQLLAEAQGLQGDLDHAWINLSKAIKILGQTDERHWGSPLYRTRASLYSLQGDLEKAEIDLRKAIDIAHRRSAKSWELQAAIDMARLRHEQGRLEEARAGLLDVYSWFSEGFDTPDLKQARKLLQSLDAQ